jgi:hypothetical protein
VKPLSFTPSTSMVWPLVLLSSTAGCLRRTKIPAREVQSVHVITTMEITLFGIALVVLVIFLILMLLSR